jgi:hypothetical protein
MARTRNFDAVWLSTNRTECCSAFDSTTRASGGRKLPS